MKPPRPIPFFFGPKGRELFGWQHEPIGPRRSVGVVLCAPLHHEMTYTYRALRHLAERLATAGFPVLRFDYDGTGDSVGNDLDPDRVRAWMDSIAHAIEALRRRTGVERTAIVGMRLGGSLATLVAAKRGDVDDLVLFAPAITGKAYVRELKALGMLGTAQSATEARGPEAKDVEGQEAAGFVITAPTLRALKDLDLTKLASRPARDVLIVPRDDVPSDDALQHHLRSIGAHTETRALPGYRAVMDEPLRSVVPDAVLNAIVEHLVTRHVVDPDATEPARSVRSIDETATLILRGKNGPVREAAQFFGGREHSFGIVTEPLERVARSKTAVVMLNTATDTRVGPNRMYVDLARDWAGLGFTVLRVDLSGIGDTPARDGVRENAAFSPRFVDDAKSAMDFLQTRGAERFVLMGLCSGAYRAYHTAVADRRVAGAVLLNPQSFHYKEGDEFVRIRAVHYYRHAIFRGETWKKALRGDIDFKNLAPLLAIKLRQAAEARVEMVAAKLRGRRDPSLDVAEFLEELCARDVDLNFIFGATDPGLDYLLGHLGSKEKKLRAHPNFHVRIIDGTDHTFTRHWAREELAGVMTKNLVDKFG